MPALRTPQFATQVFIVAWVITIVTAALASYRAFDDYYYDPYCADYGERADPPEVRGLRLRGMDQVNAGRWSVIPESYRCIWMGPIPGGEVPVALTLPADEEPPASVAVARLSIILAIAAGSGALLFALSRRGRARGV